MREGSSCCDRPRPNWLKPEMFEVLSSLADVPSIDCNQPETVSTTDESVSLIDDDLPRDPVVDRARDDPKDGSVDVEPVRLEKLDMFPKQIVVAGRKRCMRSLAHGKTVGLINVLRVSMYGSPRFVDAQRIAILKRRRSGERRVTGHTTTHTARQRPSFRLMMR
jgi:hypothetical protein